MYSNISNILPIATFASVISFIAGPISLNEKQPFNMQDVIIKTSPIKYGLPVISLFILCSISYEPYYYEKVYPLNIANYKRKFYNPTQNDGLNPFKKVFLII